MILLIEFVDVGYDGDNSKHSDDHEAATDVHLVDITQAE